MCGAVTPVFLYVFISCLWTTFFLLSRLFSLLNWKRRRKERESEIEIEREKRSSKRPAAKAAIFLVWKMQRAPTFPPRFLFFRCSYFEYSYLILSCILAIPSCTRGPGVAQWLRHWATSRRVSGSIPSGVAGDLFRCHRRNHVPWDRLSL